jgi:hypothetical protein
MMMKLKNPKDICLVNPPHDKMVAARAKGQDMEKIMVVLECVRFEVCMAVTVMNAVSWDVMLCGSCKNQCAGGTYCLNHLDD